MPATITQRSRECETHNSGAPSAKFSYCACAARKFSDLRRKRTFSTKSAQSVSSARGISRSANRRIADCRPRASGYRPSLAVGSTNTAIVTASALLAGRGLDELPTALIVQAVTLPAIFGALSQTLAYRRTAKASVGSAARI